MPDHSGNTRKRILEPNERIAEILFGLIMVLTCTGTLSVAEIGDQDVRIMLIAAIGCNLAWGIIDAVFYLIGCMADTGRSLLTYRAVRRTTDSRQAESLIADALPEVIAAVLRPEEIAAIRHRLQQLPEPPAQAHLSRADFTGALGVFFLVFLSTFPVALPFIFIHDHLAAMRLSNAIAVVMLFIAGFAYGRYIGRQPWIFGAAMVLLGSVLVALTIAFGG